MIAERVGGSPSVVNYAMFCAVIGFLSLFYLIPATFVESLRFHPFLMTGVDVLNTFFYFTCAVALSAELTTHSCGNTDYIRTNKITNGTGLNNQTKRCHEAQASAAFLWFGFASFAASAVLDLLQGSSGGGGMRGPRRGGPSMSKV